MTVIFIFLVQELIAFTHTRFIVLQYNVDRHIEISMRRHFRSMKIG